MPKFAMIDLKISNLWSVWEAFRRVGADVTIVQRPENMDTADAVILPGVGAFADGMKSLSDQGLVEPIRRYALDLQKPIIGICLGMQLMAETSEEYGFYRGLGLVKGQVKRLQPTHPQCRVPNMGWCDVTIIRQGCKIFACTQKKDPIFYFAHSYHLVCDDPLDTVAILDYDGPITASIERNNIFGLQFHPEKSQGDGLAVLSAFVNYVQEQ